MSTITLVMYFEYEYSYFLDQCTWVRVWLLRKYKYEYMCTEYDYSIFWVCVTNSQKIIFIMCLY